MDISVDEFGKVVQGILDKSVVDLEKGVVPAVSRGCREGRDKCRDYAGAWPLVVTGVYMKGFSYKVDKRNHNCVGEVGNSLKPGLVHLLEKGHATIGGGHVRAYPHVAEAAEDAFKVYEKEIDRAVEEALHS